MTIDEQIEKYHSDAISALKEAKHQCDIAAELAMKIQELQEKRK
jgi:hypothetical protein